MGSCHFELLVYVQVFVISPETVPEECTSLIFNITLVCVVLLLFEFS